MSKLTGNKRLGISDEQLLKMFRSAAILQCFISFFFLLTDKNLDNKYLYIFIIYNIFIWGVYVYVKLNFKKILKYNVSFLFLVLDILPVFLYLIVLLTIISNIIINLLLLISMFIMFYAIQKSQPSNSENKSKTRATYLIIIGGSFGVFANKIMDDNILLNNIILLLCLSIFYGIIFYMFRLVRIYENDKQK